MLSVLFEAKTQYFGHLSFNSTLQLINGILSDHQKLLRDVIDTTNVVFLKIPLLHQLQCLLTISLYM